MKTEPALSTAEVYPEGPRQLFAALMLVLSLALLVCLMATRGSSALSVPVGGVLCTMAAIGAVVLLGPAAAHPGAESVDIATKPLFKQLGLLLATGCLWLACLALGVRGSGPAPRLTQGLLIAVSFLGFGVALCRLLQTLRFIEPERPAWKHYGFWLLAFHALVYLPMLGSFSLIDPWETHYGEVAREMLARDDWISLWWAQDGWFWSKPVLDFWLQGLSFLLLGVEYLPDQMLSGLSDGRVPYPEWAARTPIFLMALLASYALYKAVARAVHPRAGFLAALVLCTTPYWFLLSHQTMTDMPYVAAMVVCLACFVLALCYPATAEARLRVVRLGSTSLTFGPQHLLAILILVAALPQITYLISRNLSVDFGSGALGIHADVFMAGSGGGNCGLPGNDECRRVAATHAEWQPALLGCLWLFLSLWLVRGLLRETRLRAMYYQLGWFALALSVMGKGAPGLVLPLFVIVVFLGTTRRWRELLSLRPFALVLILAVVAMPWYVQMFARHGHGFIDRLLLHDMYKRAFDHVHDTNQGVDVSFRYYLWQLGYGLFPWSGFVVAALFDWIRRAPDAPDDGALPNDGALPDGPLTTQHASWFFALWFVAAFAMFAISGTKFHHYILPAVPPLAVLLGVLLHRMLDAKLSSAPKDDAAATAAFALLGAVGAWLVGRDLLTQQGEHLPGEVLLMQLFTYQYKRPWPEHLHFEGYLLACTCLAALVSLAMLVAKIRSYAVLALCSIGVLWTAWGVNLYLVEAAPHWGQRESIVAYYRARTSNDPPLVAYQMNWKGENFYTGNRVAAFVQSGQAFKDWIAKQRDRGVRTLWVTTEPSRFNALKRELGSYRRFEVLTSDRVNNKFAIAKVTL